MTDKKIIALVGATGAQAGGLTRAILADPDGGFGVRALTRDASTPAAQALAAQGAEVLEVDLSDLDSLTRAFTGAYGAYCLTFFWSSMSAEAEIEEGRLQAQAARAAGLQHVLWSTLPDPRHTFPLDDEVMPTLQGRFKVPHFEGKYEAGEFFRDLGVPTTFFRTVFYYENFINFGLEPRRDENGVLVLNMPLGLEKLPMIATEDIGRAAYGVFKRGLNAVGQTVDIIGDHLTGGEIAAELTAAFGEKIGYAPMTLEQYRLLDFPGADELANQFQYFAAMEDFYAANLAGGETRELDPEVITFEDWLPLHKDEIPIEK